MLCASIVHIPSFSSFFFSFISSPSQRYPAISDGHFFSPDILANVPSLSPQGPPKDGLHPTHSHFTCQAEAGPIIISVWRPPARALRSSPFTCLTGTLFFSDSSSIGWASSFIGVAVCGWLGSVKESPESKTGRWMDCGVTAPGAERPIVVHHYSWPEGDGLLHSITGTFTPTAHTLSHCPSVSHTLTNTHGYERISAWIFSLAWMIVTSRPSQRVSARTGWRLNLSVSQRLNCWEETDTGEKYIFHLNSSVPLKRCWKFRKRL